MNVFGQALVRILGFRICNLTYEDLLKQVKNSIDYAFPIQIFTANASSLVAGLRDYRLAKCINSAEIIIADGMSIVWAARFLGYSFSNRCTGVDSIRKIALFATNYGYSIFFMGARLDVIEKAVNNIKKNAKNLKVAGFRSGYFTDDNAVICEIKQANPDILFVGMGFPKQDLWIAENKKNLDVSVVMGVGGSFDVIAGRLLRAPRWMQKMGLEWFFRFLQEPRRLWKRYLLNNSLFIYEVIKCKLRLYNY